MSSRQPKRVSNEAPHQKLDPREVKTRASSPSRTPSREIVDDFVIEEFISYTERQDASDHRRGSFCTLADRFYHAAEEIQ